MRRKLYGEQLWTDAEVVRAHVRKLSAAGIGWKRVAALAGVSSSCMSTLLYGKGGRVRGRVRVATAAKILAVRAEPTLLAESAVVDATGTVRRLQALVATGWNLAVLARHLGMTRANIGALLERPRVVVRTSRAVAELYDELWNAAPPASTRRERASVTRARQMAGARDWAPPMAWDDETIDDPAARPAGVPRRRVAS